MLVEQEGRRPQPTGLVASVAAPRLSPPRPLVARELRMLLLLLLLLLQL
jgi:hypothetical protein